MTGGDIMARILGDAARAASDMRRFEVVYLDDAEYDALMAYCDARASVPEPPSRDPRSLFYMGPPGEEFNAFVSLTVHTDAGYVAAKRRTT